MLIFLSLFLSLEVSANNNPINQENYFSTNIPETRNEKNDQDVIYVIGSQEKAFFTPGSAHFIESKELKKFGYQDINRVLDKVPGVYVQEEDGLGLRPNIGLRGAHPHRSKKITLMEDGILIGPAPYAAPAAYYFPSTNRINSLEVFKGPSSVQYGPNSIGGAVNMITPSLFREVRNDIDLSIGNLNQFSISTTGTKSDFSWLLKLNRKEGNLLRNLPGTKNADFFQNDLLFKLGKKLNSYSQRIEAKFSYSNEDSDETYLGTSLEDYQENPLERYSASTDDNIQWSRWGAQLSYSIRPKKELQITTTLYHHQMKRNWFKFTNFADAVNLQDLLNQGIDPDNRVSILNGTRDTANANERLRLGNNDRRYYSQGLQTKAKLSLDTGAMAHELKIGVKLHRDQVQRNHTDILANMVNGGLEYIEGTNRTTNKNEDTSQAYALFIEDEIFYGDATVSLGARVENISHERNPRNGEEKQFNDESFFVPGIGLNYLLSPDLVLLAGINKGVSLVGPGQDNSILPEETTNYEIGMRLKQPIYLEVIGFYSDYKNIKGNCSFSTGCPDEQVDSAFNGGRSEIFGVETMLTHSFKRSAFTFPFKLGHTFTVARFQSSFNNTNPEWGPTNGNNLIQVNDPLPYIPQNQINVGTGIQYRSVAFNLNLLWKDQVADQSVSQGRQIIPAYGVVDVSFNYNFSEQGTSYLRVNNLLDNTYLIGLRPFGLRPGAPRTIVAGLNHRF